MTAGLVLGFITGLTYGLLAVGIVLIFRANRFINMAHAQLGNPGDARRWFAQATSAMERDQPGHTELRRLCDEAEAILPAGILTPEAAR